MLVESITAGVVEGFVSTITDYFLRGKKTSVDVVELREVLLRTQLIQGELHDRVTGVEQLIGSLADHEPFAVKDQSLVVAPSVQGTSVEHALEEFASSVMAQIAAARGELGRAESGSASAGPDAAAQDADPLAAALAGFHDELREVRAQSEGGGRS